MLATVAVALPAVTWPAALAEGVGWLAALVVGLGVIGRVVRRPARFAGRKLVAEPARGALHREVSTVIHAEVPTIIDARLDARPLTNHAGWDALSRLDARVEAIVQKLGVDDPHRDEIPPPPAA